MRVIYGQKWSLEVNVIRQIITGMISETGISWVAYEGRYFRIAFGCGPGQCRLYIVSGRLTDQFVAEILKVLEVEKWELLTHTWIRVRLDEEENLVDFGHYSKDEWVQRGENNYVDD